jgi:hypothetical protein
LCLALLGAALAAQARTPPRGGSERRAIMDAMRPYAEEQLGGAVQFGVRTLRVEGGYAYASVYPQHPNGRPYRIDRGGPMNAYAGALLERRDGRWRVVEFRLGPTDVWYLGYCSRVPAGLLDGC